MKKIVAILCSVCLCLTACGSDVNSNKNVEENVEKEDSAQQEAQKEATPTEEADTNENQYYELTEMDVKKLELKLETVRGSCEHYSIRKQYYQGILDYDSQSVNYDELIQQRLLKCYQENTMLALEMKTLLVASLGVEVPNNPEQQEGMTEKWLVDLRQNILDTTMNSVASPEVIEYVKGGFAIAKDAYDNNATLEGMLDDVKNSVVEGVYASIEQSFYDNAKESLSEVTGGLSDLAIDLAQSGSVEEFVENKVNGKTGNILGTIEDVSNFDTTTAVYVQSLSDSASSASANMLLFLEKDKITSSEIMEVMYQYSQFGNTMNLLNEHGVTTNFDWQENYNKMNAIYDQFVCNEIMITKLEERRNQPETNWENKENETQEEVQNVDVGIDEDESKDVELEKYQEVLASANPDGEYYSQYEELVLELSQCQEEVNQYYEIKQKANERFGTLPDFHEQISNLKDACSDLLNYKTKNFTVEYDQQAAQWIEDNNKVNYAIGKFAKYTPWSVSLGLLTAMTIDSNSAYFNIIVEANDRISEAYQPALRDINDSLENLHGILHYYDEMSSYGNNIQEQYENFVLLNYIQQGQDIDISPYVYDVYKNLYVYATEMQVAGDLYSTISSSSNGSTYYNQSNEAMDIVEKGGYKEQIESELTKEDLSNLLGIYQAGIKAIKGLETVSQMENRRIHYIDLHDISRGSRVYRCVLNGYVVNVCNDPNRSKIHLQTFFLKNRPFYINGTYIHNNIVLLSEKEDADGTVLQEEATWILQNFSDSDEWFEHYDNLKSQTK